MKQILRLGICLTCALAYNFNLNAAGSSWFLWNTETEDAIQEVCKTGIKVDPETLGKITNRLEQTNITVQELRPSIKKASEALDYLSANSILNESHARNVMKSCAFTALGFCICCCGTKLIYDACENMSTKMSAEKNEEKTVREILSWRDFIKPAIGIAALGLGCTIIIQQ